MLVKGAQWHGSESDFAYFFECCETFIEYGPLLIRGFRGLTVLRRDTRSLVSEFMILTWSASADKLCNLHSNQQTVTPHIDLWTERLWWRLRTSNLSAKTFTSS